MKFYLEVKADTNDADYISERNSITEKQLERLKPLFKAIKNCRCQHNWGSGEYCDSDEEPSIIYSDMIDLVDEFRDFVPHGEHGVHTIASIILLEVVKEKELL
jgi:hypothetical protein